MKKNLLFFFVMIFLSLFSFAKSKTNEKFEKPIAKYLSEIQSCREQGSGQVFIVSGKVVVDLKIEDKGFIERIKINDDETTLQDFSVQKCIVLVMKKIKFPAAPKNRTVSFSYTVFFK
jgi:hypothetical protein